MGPLPRIGLVNHLPKTFGWGPADLIHHALGNKIHDGSNTDSWLACK